MMCLIICGAILHVPRLANDFSAIINETGEKEKERDRDEHCPVTTYDDNGALEDDEFDLGADATTLDFQDEARLRGLLAARERAKTLAEDEESSQSKHKGRREQREDSHVYADGKPTADTALVSPPPTIAQLNATSINAVLEASLPNTAEREELYRWLELQLLRSHSMNEVIQLCNVWHIEYKHRSEAAKRLVQHMFDLHDPENGNVDEHYASPDSSPEPDLSSTLADVIPIST